ncbi:DNA recombination protein RmuC [Testudinibacter sp. TR-2022]|uniref:DNA recombination protein RmuC n=1 Tax=Testudinibacter sp. TR-2022 TaxID=2585029 RepID=UPI00111B797A|nr:DNA recombination protein RmuC [Testudinibacter sp. TR-2022]TNH09229.1 DNA recombination protein RmuC [Pasteurellaceae bacterium Phil11]TNH25782.1 DNA recombination protein RmuC [Testudinibacter sp. TR-2022]TNH28585.1 DNA recombination protein RmuC [Testudinibacter sp. TR-2022]
MTELSQNQWLLICAVLTALCLLLFFIAVRRKRDSQELQQDLNKNIDDFNQLLEKYDSVQQLRETLQQRMIQAQTRSEGLQQRLEERDEKIGYLQQEFDQLQQRNEGINRNITELKERYGSASAQAQSLQQQLLHSQSAVEQKEQGLQQQRQQLSELAQQLTELKTTLSEKEKNFAEQQHNFEQSKQQLSVEFQNLANRILEEKSQAFRQSNQHSIDSLLKPFREQIESFQKRVNEVHSEAIKGNTALEGEIKKVLEIGLSMSQEANNLTSALKGSKKTAGNWGEMQLERSLQLAGLVAGDHYATQASFQDSDGKRKQPDFIVKLPDDKHLIIDSKVSLVDYERAVGSEEEQQQHYLSEHVKAIRNHINELSNKDYSNLIGMRSPNFVLMFIPIEPAYIEAMKLDRTLFNDAYNKNVILVSHTTLMPILRTVANLWRIERGNSEAREISERAGELYNQVSLLAERLQKLGGSLTAANNHYNNTVTALVGNQGLYGKVERFKTLSAKVTKTLPEVETLQSNIETDRLVILLDEQITDE